MIWWAMYAVRTIVVIALYGVPVAFFLTVGGMGALYGFDRFLNFMDEFHDRRYTKKI